mmetsp:Transcript_2339/g.9172  ORF Transcript_2339/g.9172 Transcript_2339/m.9172 type:complete len:239 (-) Transcript_2339:776-1492(-)
MTSQRAFLGGLIPAPPSIHQFMLFLSRCASRVGDEGEPNRKVRTEHKVQINLGRINQVGTTREVRGPAIAIALQRVSLRLGGPQQCEAFAAVAPVQLEQRLHEGVVVAEGQGRPSALREHSLHKAQAARPAQRHKARVQSQLPRPPDDHVAPVAGEHRLQGPLEAPRTEQHVGLHEHKPTTPSIRRGCLRRQVLPGHQPLHPERRDSVEASAESCQGRRCCCSCGSEDCTKSCSAHLR